MYKNDLHPVFDLWYTHRSLRYKKFELLCNTYRFYKDWYETDNED